MWLSHLSRQELWFCFQLIWQLFQEFKASLVAQMVKNLPAVQETWLQFLGGEDPLEKEMATHCSILAWKVPWTKEPGGLQSMGSQRVRHDWATNLQHLHFQLSSVAQSCPTLCDPTNRSTPGLPVHHQLLEFTQTHVIESAMPASHLILCRPISSCPQSLPASGSFPVSQLFS